MSFAPDTAPMICLAQLLAMLRYRRRYGSQGEKSFIQRFIAPLEPQVLATNRVVVVPMPDGSASKTLFSCHTDTVHRGGGKQVVVYDADLCVVYKEDGHPLGADDGAGVFLCLHMIRHRVPGTYVFHTGEECGGIGSGAMAEEEPEFLARFDRAVAFDRRGTASVITHQGGDRCCSQTFGNALALALNDADLTESFSYQPDDSGLFTDTANYTHVIPECTNISVGYEGEHTAGEMLDVQHLMTLASALVRVDWEVLPTVRDPSVVDDDNWFRNWTRGYSTISKDYVYPDNDYNSPSRREGGGAAGKSSTWDDAGEEQKYADAVSASSELFSELSARGMDKAYYALRTSDVFDFFLADRESFCFLLDALYEGVVDDDQVIGWVQGY